MENVDSFPYLNGIDCSIGVFVKPGNDFENSTTNSLQRFGIVWGAAFLHVEKGNPDILTDHYRESFDLLEAIPYPDDRFYLWIVLI